MEDDDKLTEQFLIRVGPALKAFFIALAKRRHIKVAQLIREVLYDYKEAKEKVNGEL